MTIKDYIAKRFALLCTALTFLSAFAAAMIYSMTWLRFFAMLLPAGVLITWLLGKMETANAQYAAAAAMALYVIISLISIRDIFPN